MSWPAGRGLYLQTAGRNPLDSGVVIGPLINDRAVEVMDERISDAVSKGAKIITGGSHHGRVYQPTVLTDVPHDAQADHEETFGPLLVVQPVDSADEEDTVLAPMGGVRNSGWGRHGKHAREDLTDVIWVTITRDQVDLPI